MKTYDSYEIWLSAELSGDEIFYFKTELFKACNCNGVMASVIEEPQSLTVVGDIGNRPHFDSVIKRMKNRGCIVYRSGDVEL